MASAARIFSAGIIGLANAAGIDLDPGFAFELASIVIIAAVSIWELISRYSKE